MTKSDSSSTNDSEKTSELESLRRQVDELSEANFQLQLQNEALQKLVKQLQSESVTDELTGIYNRRFFTQELTRRLTELNAGGSEFLLLLMDVDQLKQINDQYGHSVGDQVLKEIASSLCRLAKPTDRVMRIGGDEFAVILDGSDVEDCNRLTSQFVNGVRLDGLANEEVASTASVGMSVAQQGDSCTTLYDRADRALYLSKTSGSNH